MTDFIIDEMVIRECDSLKDPEGNVTFRSLDFMTSFIESNHRLGVNDKIEKKYRDYQNEIKNENLYSLPLSSKIINRILRYDKLVKVDGTPRTYNPIRAKKCDIHFVGVSLQLRGTLVTNDEPLIQTIGEQGFDSQLTVVRVQNAKNQL